MSDDGLPAAVARPRHRRADALMPDLCRHHEATVTACLRKTGHHDDSTVADRLRDDLARVCPGPWCETSKPTTQEKP